jgi:hypothetical protein
LVITPFILKKMSSSRIEQSFALISLIDRNQEEVFAKNFKKKLSAPALMKVNRIYTIFVAIAYHFQHNIGIYFRVGKSSFM